MSIYKMSKEAEKQALERLAKGVRERAEREKEDCGGMIDCRFKRS